MNHHDPSPADLAGDLLRRTTTTLAPDVDRLVAEGIARGRRHRRRRTAGASLAAVAVLGVIGSVTAGTWALKGGEAREVGYADSSATPSAKPTPSATPTPDPRAIDELITVSATQFPAKVGELVPTADVGALRTDMGVDDERQQKVAHFMVDGTLTTLTIERADSLGSCHALAKQADTTCRRDDAGHLLLTWGPSPSDGGVLGQGVMYWNHGFIVSALSYNAAEGKDAPAVTDQPALSLEQLLLIASSEVWFTP